MSSFSITNGNRSYAPNVAVVISGVPYDQGPDPVSAAQIAKNQNIKILSVGVDKADLNDAAHISSNPNLENITYWSVPTFKELFSRVNDVYEQICGPAIYPGNC